MNKENNEHKTIINENKIETKAGNLKQLISECFTGSHRNELFARIVWISDAAPDLSREHWNEIRVSLQVLYVRIKYSFCI